MRAALTSMGLALPPKRVLVNLAPADVLKEGSHFDLPVALAVLAAMDVHDRWLQTPLLTYATNKPPSSAATVCRSATAPFLPRSRARPSCCSIRVVTALTRDTACGDAAARSSVKISDFRSSSLETSVMFPYTMVACALPKAAPSADEDDDLSIIFSVRLPDANPDVLLLLIKPCKASHRDHQADPAR